MNAITHSTTAGPGLTRTLLAAPSVPSKRVDIYSGVARLSGTVWASEVVAEGPSPDTAVMVVHPTSNMLGHYALEPLARRGVAAVGLTTRYVGNDSSLITENCLLDIAAMVAHLRERGYRRVILVGNSGGASVVPYYQAQAEHTTVTDPPGGGPDLTAHTLPPADGVVMLNAHSGRARLLTEWLDPAIADESEPFVRDPDLDMFDERNGPPYTAEFVARFRAAQVERNHRITRWAQARLRSLPPGVDDFPFVVHGTYADPRSLDGTLEPSDREVGVSLWGPPASANYLPAAIARYTTARSWLNQWSLEHAQGDALRWLREVTVPVLIVYGTGDTAAHPRHALDMYEAVRKAPRDLLAVPGAGHYFEGQPELRDQACDRIVAWAADRN
ncbi:alpha/beta hydrolase [Streptomyces sp. NPDC046805]|uniref:alpha/beta hydrolase n=1 Tax=Streptomyces sp. NPDC046805 TaxID=3155134 RepID=UPI0033D06CE7